MCKNKFKTDATFSCCTYFWAVLLLRLFCSLGRDLCKNIFFLHFLSGDSVCYLWKNGVLQQKRQKNELNQIFFLRMRVLLVFPNGGLFLFPSFLNHPSYFISILLNFLVKVNCWSNNMLPASWGFFVIFWQFCTIFSKILHVNLLSPFLCLDLGYLS